MNNKEKKFYRMRFYPPNTNKERAKIKKTVIGIMNGMKLPYYINLSDGGYAIYFMGDNDIILDDLVDEKTGKDIGKVEMISEAHFNNARDLMKKHMESQFISESEYQKMSKTEKYNHLKKMIESFVLNSLIKAS